MRIQLSDHFTYKKLFMFVLPSIVMMVFTSVYSVVDGLFVANFAGEKAVSAINLIFPLIMVLGSIGFMLGAGGSALVSKTLGEGDSEKANKYFSMLVYVTFVIGVVIAVAGQFAVPAVARLLIRGNNDETVYGYCVIYGSETLLGTIRRYGESNNITIVLIDSSTGKAVLNSGREGEFLARKAQRYVLGMGHEQTEILVQCDNYVVEKNQDHRQGGNYLESWGFFSDNNTLFLMQMPLASIRESVALSNRFITYVGIAAMVLGSIVMYLATWQVANPVMKLAALSERMSNLDFDARYEGDAQDEIGILGRSMNKLSEKLKETIGELKDANQQLQHDIEEKIQIDEMRKEFIANVSHELKTPIALIQGYAEGLTEGMAEDAQSRDYYCEVIMDEADKMNKRVKQLLTLTALEFGNDTPSMITFDITEMIRDFLNSASILFHQKDAHVDFEADGPLYVCADEFKTEEVLRNYLSNAMNHLDGARRIRVRAARTGESVTVWVYNTGNPIPQEDLPNLWTKFFKVDKARTRAYGGSGIGLSIVKAVQDAHHQICGVANVEDGVEFFFTLQAAREPES